MNHPPLNNPAHMPPVRPNPGADLSGLQGPQGSSIPFAEEEKKEEALPDNYCPYCFKELTEADQM